MSSDRPTASDSMRSALMGLGLTELSLFLCLWTAMTLWASFMFARSAYYQIWPATYPTTQGEVVRSRVRPGRKDELDLRYTYSVNGRQFTGHRYLGRFNLVSENDVEDVAASLPAGTRVTVYYHPDDPNISQLKAGLNNGVLLGILLLGVFDAIAIGGVDVGGHRGSTPPVRRRAEEFADRTESRANRDSQPPVPSVCHDSRRWQFLGYCDRVHVRHGRGADGPPTFTLAAIGAAP